MIYLTRLAIISLALGLSTGAFASFLNLDQDNGDYGNQGPQCTATLPSGETCNITTGSPFTSASIFAQSFGYSQNSSDATNFQIYEFEVLSGSNYTLTLTGTNNFADASKLGTVVFGSGGPYAYGMFVCGPDDPNNPGNPETNNPTANNRMCTPSGSNTSGVSESLLAPNSVEFSVSGAGSNFVFYVVENNVGDPILSADLEPIPGSPVPEPDSLPLLAAAIGAVVLFGRKRLARLQ